MKTEKVLQFVRVYQHFLQLDDLVSLSDNPDIEEDWNEAENKLYEAHDDLSPVERMWVDENFPDWNS